MRVFKDHHEFSRLPTYFLVMHVVVLVMPLAKAMPMQSQKADQEVQKQEQEERLFKRSVSTISVDPDFHKIPETPQRHDLPEVPDVSPQHEPATDQLEPQTTKQGLQDVEPEKTSNVSLPNRLLATKLALGAMLANGAEKLLSGNAALTNKLANAARAAWRTKITLATIIKSSRPNYHMAGSEEALNGNDETFLKWLEGDEMRQIWLNKQHKTLVSVLESAIATKIALGGILMGAIKNELQAKTSLAEKFAWAAKVASREKLIWALRVGSELGLKDDMPLPKYETLSDDKKWKEYLEELEKFAEKHRIVGWNKIVLG